MSVVFASPPSLFKTPSGTAVGMPIINGSPINIVSVSAKKSGNNPIAQLSNWGQGLGGTPNGPPGTLSQYLSGLGIITGMSGSFHDSISTYDGAAIIANINGAMHTLEISGIAFHRVEQPSGGGGSCSVLHGHGIEGILAYFQDNRLGNIRNAGRYTVVKIGATKLDCAVIGVKFSMLDTEYNLWNWTLRTLVAPNIQAGADSATL